MGFVHSIFINCHNIIYDILCYTYTYVDKRAFPILWTPVNVISNIYFWVLSSLNNYIFILLILEPYIIYKLYKHLVLKHFASSNIYQNFMI